MRQRIPYEIGHTSNRLAHDQEFLPALLGAKTLKGYSRRLDLPALLHLATLVEQTPSACLGVNIAAKVLDRFLRSG